MAFLMGNHHHFKQFLALGRRLLGGIRTKLPAEYSSSVLCLIRAGACRSAAPGQIECDMWSQTSAMQNSGSEISSGSRPFLKSTTYECHDCKRPFVPEMQVANGLKSALGGSDGFATWKRLASGRQRMSADQLRKVTAWALARGWLTYFEAAIAVQQANMQACPSPVQMDDFSWSFREVINDWKQRRPSRARDTLPPRFTSSTLRYIRKIACMRSAPETIECEKWSQTDPCPPDSPGLYFRGGQKGPFVVTAGYVCDRCKQPRVTSEHLFRQLGLAADKEDFSDRTWRRYINADQPMPVDQFRRVIANAYVVGWLGPWQALSIWWNIDQLVATKASLLAVTRRASERKDFEAGQKLGVSEIEIKDELAKQLRILQHETTHGFHQRLKDETLPPELRQLFEEAILEARAGTRPTC
ncbi:hypothetical protein [Denitratisoma oestradiolicum]|uniref:Uncharacterized protein n=1 Tax=Denitratisoma oestradiolicum TaxID=311182 RepID=A0A6S6Y1Y9_9PROT|nr:hypothetical protein [Denitratisoma oestradiolicum]CAB1369323.1 protein of unknown function [Denitratisoma oestradiolicum]